MQNDACSTVPEKSDFLLKQMSKCLGCFARPPGIVSPSVDEVSGSFELESGWCSKSPLQGCSALARSTMHGLEDLELCASSGRDGLAAPESSG